MPMPRSLGGTKMPLSVSHTVSLAMTIRPASGRSSPARQRSVVVLPQPEGPSSVISLPVSMPRLMPSTAFTTTLPGATKVLRRFSMANMEIPTLRPAALAAAASLRRCTRSSSQRRPATMMISGMIWMTPSAETAP